MWKAMYVEEIVHLIGYCDCNSFVRAFNSWTGVSVWQYKNEIRSKQLN